MSDMTPATRKDKVAVRIEKTNDLVDEQVTAMMTELDTVASDLDAIIEIFTDRAVQSTDLSFGIALARITEVRMDVFKKKIDILKTLVNDKSTDLNARKKSSMSDLDSILSGASLGAALGAAVTTQNSINQKNEAKRVFDTIDADVEDIQFETEHLNTSNSLKDSSIESLLNGNSE